MDIQTSQDKFQVERESRIVREATAKAQFSTDLAKARVAQAETDRVEAVAARIHTSISARFFLAKELAVIEPEYARLLKLHASGDEGYYLDPQKFARLDFVRQEIARLDAYLQSVTDFTQGDIEKANEEFEHSQGAPERLEKAASNAAKKIEADARPQVAQGRPVVTYPCPKCDSNLPSAGVALHHGPNGWCVINPRKAYASGRDAYWLLSEGGCTVQDLLAAGIAVPQL